MVSELSSSEVYTQFSIRRQIEFYLSDRNIQKDKFFREQVLKDKEGWVEISQFLDCNRIRAMKIGKEEIAAACEDSRFVDVSADKLKIRRRGNRALPELREMRQRDAKAADKKAAADARGGGRKPASERFAGKNTFLVPEKEFCDP